MTRHDLHLPNDTTLYHPLTADTVTRRRVLQGMLGAGAMAAIGLPAWAEAALAGGPLGADDRILVTVMMGGGNDGLNTLAPAENGTYRDLRGPIAITPETGLSVGEGLYLNPQLGRLKARFDAGQVAIVQGVGDPGLDHSHFSCMAKWMAGQTTGVVGASGWLGRYLDGLGVDGFGGISIGDHGVPLHLRRLGGETIGLPTWGDLFGADNRNDDGTPSFSAPVHAAIGALGSVDFGRGPWMQALAGSQAAAIDASRSLRPAFRPEIPDGDEIPPVWRDLQLAARVINLDLGARVFAIGFGDFDTHDVQEPRHSDLLAGLDLGIEEFFAAVEPRLRDRIVLMTFSEFGRRPELNGSVGVDHGTSSCLFVCGEAVKGGLYGQYPNINRLDERGDLRVHVDYRDVYASVLEGYLGADAGAVLGGNYENLGLFDSTGGGGGGGGATCAGQTATIVGTAGDDVLKGTPGRDVIVGRGGADRIAGGGGNDLVCAGGGDDDVRGGRGRDTLRGQGGADRLAGNRGADRLLGGKGQDTLLSDALDTLVRQ